MAVTRTGLGTLLRLLVARLDDDVQRLYDELDLPFRPRFYPLVARLREGPASVTELARAARVSQPAATQTLGELRKAGLVAVNAGSDRRQQLMHLTAEGEELATRLAPVWEAVARATESVDPDLAARIERALTALDAEPFAARIRKELDVD